MLQKAKCDKCGRRSRNTANWMKGSMDGKKFAVCEQCMTATRAAMMADPNHPAWKTYHALVAALRKAWVL